jgi:nucleotide-binding universal stress UspA family protein
MSQIVVGYDGSATSDGALDRAVELAKGLGDTIVVVFGYAPPGVWGGEIVEHEEAIEELGTKVTHHARERAAAAGIEIEVQMVAKRGSEALIEVASSRRARMIVVGSYGETPLKGAILGSTAYKLLHQASMPVLVVPPPT